MNLGGCMIKCIYCSENKDATHFKRKEHVLPQSFGKFKDNLTLINTVCDECNQFFGDNLENYLAYDTFEGGTTRYEAGIKELIEFKSLGKRSRMEYKIQEGPHIGAYMYRKYNEDANSITWFPCPQVGFLKNTGQYEWFMLTNKPSKELITSDIYLLSDPKCCIILGCNESEQGQIICEYGLKGVEEIIVSQEKDKTNYLFEYTATLNEIDFRVRAKIAFNYLTYYQGKDFVLDDRFNVCRDYIRWGKIPEVPNRRVLNRRFFPDGKRRNVHIIAVHWDETEKSLVARVSLFDYLQYIIRLTKDNDQKCNLIQKGHIFNIKQMNIVELDLSKFELSS
jgi:hypothetical protein